MPVEKISSHSCVITGRTPGQIVRAIEIFVQGTRRDYPNDSIHEEVRRKRESFEAGQFAEAWGGGAIPSFRFEGLVYRVEYTIGKPPQGTLFGVHPGGVPTEDIILGTARIIDALADEIDDDRTGNFSRTDKKKLGDLFRPDGSPYYT